ncbi:MAG: spore germination protein [Clostridia bacterium]|nr:spore germination protein [Clostridia bacterium]
MKRSISENAMLIKRRMPSEDILSFSFTTRNGTACKLFYADGIVDKEMMGRLVITPLTAYGGTIGKAEIMEAIAFPEVKTANRMEQLEKEIAEGNPVLFVDGIATGFIVGTKKVPVRAITEPQTGLVTKGPRAGFIEDVKTNMAQVRLRFKTGKLRFLNLKLGKQSQTNVAICYLDGIAKETVVREIEERLQSFEIDAIPDSSYVGRFLCQGQSLFKRIGTTEKPDVFAARIAEGRVGVLVDGSPVALTLPYLLLEDFQSAEDYFVNPVRASFTRLLRFAVATLAVLLPALYVSAQLFKLQLIPLPLLLTIASSIQGLPLSPSLELFLTLTVLELLMEASVRMPKYVGLALSVVGALTLGDTAVNAGILSTPAVILVAFSGIALYTVPDLVETTSPLRLIALIVAGSIGTYGIVTGALFLLVALVGEEQYGSPLLAPFSPMKANDLKDSLVRASLPALDRRPRSIGSKNRIRFKETTCN